MWFFLYNVGLVVASPVILLVLLAKKRCRRGLTRRLGWRPGDLRAEDSDERDALRETVWIHAVSLGEVMAAVPLIRELRARYPRHRLVVSTVTETGREAVEQRLAGVAEHLYAPLDFPFAVRRVTEVLRPSVFVFVETELWPNLLRTLARRGVPTILVNGRLSTRSFERYRFGKPFLRQVLTNLTWMLMQSTRDAERIIALGAPRERVINTGNVKFDQQPPAKATGAPSLSRESISLSDDEELIVAGSTHQGEEEQLLACYQQLQREFPFLVLMMAPRHVERAAEVEALVRARGLTVTRRSRQDGAGPVPGSGGAPRVIVLDTRGELVQAYGHAVATFVGGTLVPVGGHNLLEPASWGKCVFFGPHTDHCSEIAQLLASAGGGVQVAHGDELAAEMAWRLRDRRRLRDAGEAARRVIDDNRGALSRTLGVVEKVLETPRVRQQGWEAGAQGHPVDRSSRRGVHPLWQVLLFPYALGMRARAWLYAHGWFQKRKLPCPVVSVGNLTVGGTGKTPVVILLAQWLLAQDRRVAVLSRGYRRGRRTPCLLVSDGRSVLAGPTDAGDEPYLIAQRCPGAVVAVGSDRYRLGQWVLERFPIDCFLLDDGFQHLALERDVDLLLVDASDSSGLEAMFPVGRLREPLSAARRASAVVVTRVSDHVQENGVPISIREVCSQRVKPILVRFRAESLLNIVTGELVDPGSLAGGGAVAFSGLANPRSFRDLLAQQGLKILHERVFPDHHMYTADEITEVLSLSSRSSADLVVTTEKDAGKVAPFLGPHDRVFALRLATEFLEGREELEHLVLGTMVGNGAAA